MIKNFHLQMRCKNYLGRRQTINSMRKNWIPERTIDITFTDRYSFSVINIDKLKKTKKNI